MLRPKGESSVCVSALAAGHKVVRNPQRGPSNERFRPRPVESRGRQYSTLCPVPHDDIEEAVELIDELAACVNDLTEHIAAMAPRNRAGSMLSSWMRHT
jgi:hypothetical protein